ncbi:hypothetical protein CLV62_1556 [Dysgonomonas alginatilytica]|uniref:Uncharacterized protein n=1 Tax=Dysgonomonas alginatilytica TaxID=1605892 RepID=A0A2V3PH73_9BACT|nr:hypothetical protein [Dysgonomonas alginatilytica]PXV57142.1 hypothetical protein CLV62_1556 [Dysgonomonas alginatilytica]
MRQVILPLVTTDMSSDDRNILYYENLTNTYNGLKLIFREPYNERDKKHQKYWDRFFTDH